MAKCISKEDIKWLPIKKALAISQSHGEMNLSLEDSIDAMLKMIESLNKK